MRMKMMPTGWAYWVADGELQLGPGRFVPSDAKQWLYADVSASDSTMLMFLSQAEAAGVNSKQIARIKVERGLA